MVRLRQKEASSSSSAITMTPTYVGSKQSQLLHCKIQRIMLANQKINFLGLNFFHLHDHTVASCQSWSKLPRLPEKWKVNQIHNLTTIEKFLNINKHSYIEIIICTCTSKILGYYSHLFWNSMTIPISNWTKCICEIKMGVSHQKGEIPGNDLSANSDRFVSGVREERSFDGNRFAVVLVGPAGVVAVTTNRKF